MTAHSACLFHRLVSQLFSSVQTLRRNSLIFPVYVSASCPIEPCTLSGVDSMGVA